MPCPARALLFHSWRQRNLETAPDGKAPPAGRWDRSLRLSQVSPVPSEGMRRGGNNSVSGLRLWSRAGGGRDRGASSGGSPASCAPSFPNSEQLKRKLRVAKGGFSAFYFFRFVLFLIFTFRKDLRDPGAAPGRAGPGRCRGGVGRGRGAGAAAVAGQLGGMTGSSRRPAAGAAAPRQPAGSAGPASTGMCPREQPRRRLGAPRAAWASPGRAMGQTSVSTLPEPAGGEYRGRRAGAPAGGPWRRGGSRGPGRAERCPQSPGGRSGARGPGAAAGAAPFLGSAAEREARPLPALHCPARRPPAGERLRRASRLPRGSGLLLFPLLNK